MTAVFEYPVTEELSNGEHTASIVASDTTGNVMVNPVEINFSTDTVAPIITELNISDKIYDDKVSVSANITDSNINCAKAYVRVDGKIHTYSLEETNGLWQTEIDIPDYTSLEIWITAYDFAGNCAESEKTVINTRHTTLNVQEPYSGTISAFMEENDTSFKISVNGNLSDAKLLVAEYDGDELKNINIINGSPTDIGTEYISDIPEKNYKIMLWDKDLTPIIDDIVK